MQELLGFCDSIKTIINSHPKMDVAGARKVVCALNEFLYTTHADIGTLEMLGSKFDYFSDFHKFWHNHHKEILGCSVDDSNCEKVADALHDVYILTEGNAFKSIWNTCGLKDEDVCRVRFLTANQDFRGSRDFSDLARIFDSDNTVFDENNIKEDPQSFLRTIEVGSLSQNDKRISFAKNVSEFLLNYECSPYDLIEKFNGDVYNLRTAIIACNAGYGNKKTDMFIRDMVVLGIWKNVKGFDKINVASDVNTIKVALRTGIIKTEIPLVSSFLDIFCYQYSYIDDMNVRAWRRVWEIWRNKYPNDDIASPCLLDYFVYNVVGRQFCKEILSIFKGEDCNHFFKWHSSLNKTCQTCYSQGVRRKKASVIRKVMPCSDNEGSLAILMTDYVKALPEKMKMRECPFAKICKNEKNLMPPKSISIMGQTGWESAYSIKGQGGGGLMA